MLYLLIAVGFIALILAAFALLVTVGTLYLLFRPEKQRAIKEDPPYPVPEECPEVPTAVTQPPPKPPTALPPPQRPQCEAPRTITLWQCPAWYNELLDVSMWTFFACFALWLISSLVVHEWWASEFVVMIGLFGIGQFTAIATPEVDAQGLPRTWLTVPFIYMGFIGSALTFVGVMLLVHFVYMAVPHHVPPAEYIGHGAILALITPALFMVGHLALRGTFIEWHARRVIAEAKDS